MLANYVRQELSPPDVLDHIEPAIRGQAFLDGDQDEADSRVIEAGLTDPAQREVCAWACQREPGRRCGRHDQPFSLGRVESCGALATFYTKALLGPVRREMLSHASHRMDRR